MAIRCSVNSISGASCDKPATYRCTDTVKPSYWCNDHAVPSVCCVRDTGLSDLLRQLEVTNHLWESHQDLLLLWTVASMGVN